jgi:predicted Zn finger-like uncharacterized protein
MTLATRCPACGTAFRVVSDQLRVSSGWVRCGRCRTPFDALEHLFRHESGRKPERAPFPKGDEEMPTVDAAADRERGVTQAASAQPPSSETPSDAQPEAIAEFQAEMAAGPPFEPQPEPPFQQLSHSPSEQPSQPWPQPPGDPVPQVLDEPLLEPAAAEDATPASAPRTRDAPLDPIAPASVAAHPAVQAEPPLGTPVLAHEPLPSLQSRRDSGFQPRGRPGFVRRAEAAARWSHPATRATLGVLAGVLMLLLGAQAAVLWREEAALRWPEARPALEALCAGLGCRVEAPRRIQALAVEASGLRREPDSDGYRLELTVRNRSTLEVLAPALELSLTDAGGRLIARRVLTVAELGSPVRTLAAGQELTLQAELSTGPVPVAGYTIALFYP